MASEPVVVYDTTLRDGTQGEEITFTAEEKLVIAQRLDGVGVHYIEGGWPGSNPRDIHFFEMASRTRFKTARITAFGATRRPKIHPRDDHNLQMLLDAQTEVVTIFGKTWDLHVRRVMNNTLAENLAMIADSVAYLKEHDRHVIYDAEHFFDGYRDNPRHAAETICSAISGGADAVVLCDTNGGTLPFEIETTIDALQAQLAARFPESRDRWPLPMGIHTHNDAGMAVANTIIAVKRGISMVQGTINGYGERCGNADLTSIIPILCLKMNRPVVTADQLKQLRKLSRFVSETANLVPNNSRPFVGKSAFAHKGGVHVAAVRKVERAYEHIDPTAVGNSRRVLISDLSGKSNIEYKAAEMGVELGGNGFSSQQIVNKIKTLEEEGYQFDVADGSFKLLVERLTKQYAPLFDLESFRVAMEKDKGSDCRAHATIKISVGDRKEITAAEGLGPVSALDNALRKALKRFFPELTQMRLVDFKVRVVDGRDGTSAKVRVHIQSRDQDEVWNTIGVSHDIIEASWQALEDSFQYKLAKYNQQVTTGDPVTAVTQPTPVNEPIATR